MQLAEMAEHVLRAELDRAGAAGMEPGRSARHDLQAPAPARRRLRARASASALASKASTVAGLPDQWRPVPSRLASRGARRSPR